MVDLHLEIAYYIEYCKSNGVNYLGEKGRILTIVSPKVVEAF